jgi:hypothetical protein
MRPAQRFGSTIRRIASALLLLFAMSVAASAYTVVMRGGRHIQIPENFVVTPLTLTYEAAPGINVTLQMSLIDIAATERLNREPTGSLLRRAEGQWPPASLETGAAPATQQRRAPRTVTNRDLEASRRARERNDEAYERRAQELGLPSLEDARRRSQEEARRLGELSRQSEEEEAQAESYWRSRATELRTETAVVDAQINYLRDQLASSSRPLTISSYPIATGIGRLFPIRRRAPYVTHGMPRFGSAGVGGQPVAVVGFGGGTTRGQVLVNAASPYDTYRRQSVYLTPRVFAPQLAPFFVNYPTDDSSYERSVLVTRLRELESVRAGLSARWRLLEEEARRAGAMPGWLRP